MMCPYVLKMTSPETLTINLYSGIASEAFLYDVDSNMIYVNGNLPYTLAGGDAYSGEVKFDLCSGDDGTCVPIFTL